MQALNIKIKSVISAFILLALAGLCYWAYLPALNTPFFFDDGPNLNGLANVKDFNSALDFITNGQAGPLGRPVSLASFLIHEHTWPSNPFPLKQANVLIHIANGLLLALFGLKIGRLLRDNIYRPDLFAITLASLWMLHPLLASSSLLAIQRMTLLAGTFTLLGLILYLHGRLQIAKKPKTAYGFMFTGVISGLLLSTLSKENGALFPAYVLIIEYLLLRPLGYMRGGKKLTLWNAVFLFSPLFLLLGYFVIKVILAPGSYGARAFTLSERLLTEARVLTDYLQLIFLPTRSALGPFHDDYIISKGLVSPPSTIISIAVITLLIGLAIKYRKKLPVLAFAIFWFFVGHSMESSIVPLELYFEHRNYIPIIGPLFALSYYGWHRHLPMPKLRIAILFVLGFFFVFVLHENSLTWKNPVVAAELWVKKHPESARSSLFLSQQYSAIGQLEGARIAIERAYDNAPNDTGMALQVLQHNCLPESQTDAMRSRVHKTLLEGTFAHDAFVTLEIIEGLREKGSCPQLTIDDIHEITDALISNPNFTASWITITYLYKFKGVLYIKSGLLGPAVQYLDLAFSRTPELDTALASANLLGTAGLYKEATTRLNTALEHLPDDPLKRAHWKKEINQLMNIIETKSR